MAAVAEVATHIPRKQDQDGSDGHLANEALEPLFRLAVRVPEGLVANLEHVLAALDGRGNLGGGKGNGPPHLHRQFLG